MKYLFVIAILLGSAAFARAQDVCPAGQVCIPQATANVLLKAATDLVAAKDAIAKLTAERASSDAVIASANRVIEDFKQLDAIHAMQIASYKDVVALYEKAMAMQSELIDKLQKMLNAPRSAWQKVASALKDIGLILAGISLGRGL